MNLKIEALKEVSQQILKEAATRGASQADVSIMTNHGFTVSVREGEVETVEYNQDKVVELSVLFGKRSGSASLSDIRPEAIRRAVEAACHIAKFTDEDPDAGLADKSELAFNYTPIELSFPWSITVDKAIELACQCENEALAQDKRIMSSESTSIATGESLNVYANSEGFVGSNPFTRHEMSCVLVAKDGDTMQRDYSYSVATDPALLKSVSGVAKEAAAKTVSRLGARQIATTKAPVIFASEEARGLIGSFVSAVSGGALYRKASFLINHLDKQIFPKFVHIQEFPHIARGLGSTPFDADGVATRDNVLIEDGVLCQYLLGIYSARKLGMKSTGNGGGTFNLTVRPGDKNFNELLKTMNRGLVITELMGNGVNLITGDYSRGASGYWVENGEIQFPVQEITIAGKLQDMFMGVVEVGNDVDYRGNIRTGSILINEMMIAGS